MKARPNIQRLGGDLSSRMKKTAGANVPTTMELGRINGDLSLTVDSLSNTIPKGSYMVSLWLTHDTYYSYDERYDTDKKPTRDPHDEEDGLHDHRAPSVFRKLEPGDRVLVAWAGSEPIVISVITSSSTITTN